jgi:murein DD-endopeptidase MepM/ murein hydrolase activator NlpD
MPETNLPGANRTVQWKPQFGGITMARIDKIVLHTTETLGWPGYPNFAPQLTVDPWIQQTRQHMPLNVSASTLADPSSTAVRENRDNVLQIEIVGYCDPQRAATAKYIYKLSDAGYRYLAKILAWVHKEYGVPLVSTVKWVKYPASYGSKASQRLTSAQYDAYRGILGHQHASGNDHGDPGQLDIPKLLAMAKAEAGVTEPPPPPGPNTDKPAPQPWKSGVLPGGEITTPFGVKGDWQAGYHTGDDWNVGDAGEDYWFPVYAPKPGEVVYVGTEGWGPAYGRQVHVKYTDGRVGMFAHLASIGVVKGARVRAGQAVGRLGYSGNVRDDKGEATQAGSHLHYEERVSPYRYGDDARKPVYSEATETTALRVAFWNTRRASYEEDKGTERDWDKRAPLARDFLKALPGGLPDSLATCETTVVQTPDIARFTGLEGIGNGLGGHPDDRSGDNNSIFLGLKLEKMRVVVVHTGDSSDPRRYLLLVQAKIKSTGAVLWLGATHLNRDTTPAGRQVETRTLLAAAKAEGVDLSRLVLGLDANDSAPTSEPGVRQTAREFGLSDIRDKLSDAQFRGDSWDTYTGWDPDVEKTGRHIDVILIGAKIKVSKGEIVPVKNGASDHHLLLATVHA